MRRIVLVRHGEAVPETQDPQRPLSERGRAEVDRVAAWAARIGIAVDEVLHSGKRRAEETAAIFARHLGVSAVRADVRLAPNHPVEPLAEQIERGQGSVLIAGHMPHLGRLVGHLVVGDPDRDVVVIPTGGVVVLVPGGPLWAVEAVVGPEMLA